MVENKIITHTHKLLVNQWSYSPSRLFPFAERIQSARGDAVSPAAIQRGGKVVPGESGKSAGPRTRPHNLWKASSS